MFPFPNPMCAVGYTQALVWNAADKDPDVTLSNGDRTMATTLNTGSVRSTASKASGKWYFEVAADAVNDCGIGIGTSGADITAFPGAADAFAWGYRDNGSVENGGSGVATYATYAPGDIISVAFDLAATKLWFAKNGAWQSGDPGAGAGGLTISAGTYYAMAGSNGVTQLTSRPAVAYTLPNGFSPL